VRSMAQRDPLAYLEVMTASVQGLDNPFLSERMHTDGGFIHFVIEGDTSVLGGDID
jgi:hypothetical protein